MTLLFIIAGMFSCSDQEAIDIVAEQLSDQEIEGLVFMREEEKLARDVYTFLEGKWDKQIFTHISKSEQKHMDAVKAILDKYELNDPVIADEKGIFTSEVLQQFYNEFTAKGAESLVDALTVGATIEDLDINDLNQLISKTDNTDLLALYENLNQGSHNHIRAFTRQLENEGVKYTPVYISQAEYDAIINSTKSNSKSNAAAEDNKNCNSKAGKKCDSAKCNKKKCKGKASSSEF